MLGIIDYGLGNIGAIAHMLGRLGLPYLFADDEESISNSSGLILPGVGAFDEGISRLRACGLDYALSRAVLDRGVPILGICLGLQLMTSRSEEGRENGLGWLDASTVRLSIPQLSSDFRVPHMGWNTVDVRDRSSLFLNAAPEPRFYFAHSYYVAARNQQDVLATTRHGAEFPVALAKGNIFGVQFHPEKSHAHGSRLLRAFGRIAGHE